MIRDLSGYIVVIFNFHFFSRLFPLLCLTGAIFLLKKKKQKMILPSLIAIKNQEDKYGL